MCSSVVQQVEQQEEEQQQKKTYGIPNMRSTGFGDPILRIKKLVVLYFGGYPPIHGNYQIRTHAYQLQASKM